MFPTCVGSMLSTHVGRNLHSWVFYGANTDAEHEVLQKGVGASVLGNISQNYTVNV